MGIEESEVELNALLSSRNELISELSELGELWLELRASGRDTHHAEIALSQAGQELRRINNRIQRLMKRLGGSS